jgi:hypothetical protein
MCRNRSDRTVAGLWQLDSACTHDVSTPRPDEEDDMAAFVIRYPRGRAGQEPSP